MIARSKKLIKFAVSIAMLIFVFRFTNAAKLKEAFMHVPLTLVILVTLGYSFGQILSSYKWMLLIRAGGISCSFPRTLSAYFIGMYVNCFGLGTVGGDIARGLLVAETNAERPTGLASVVADRLLGLIVLAFIGVSATLLIGYRALEMKFVYLALGGAIVVLLGWLILPKWILHFTRAHPVLHKYVDELLRPFPRDPALLLWISFISALFHFSQIALHGLMAYSLGASIPWGYIFVSVPFVNIVSTLPLSWMGLGVRENLYVLFFVPLYLTSEQAIIFGAIWISALTIASAIGGIVAVATGDIKLLSDRNAMRAPAQPQANSL